jgi:5'-nucleotidase
MQGAPPDVVVSGANFGQNIGPSTLHSGTVGAALTAMQQGHPAIAISVGIDPSQMRAEPRFASTLAAFDDAARFVVRTIADLRATAGRGPLLPPHTALNINYPAREAADVSGVAWANIGRGTHFGIGFERAGTDSVRVVFQEARGEETVDDADTTLFDRGFVTLTLLDGDLAAPARTSQEVGFRLGDVAP